MSARETEQQPRHSDYSQRGCPVEASLELIGGKGKGAILFHLLEGTLRFNEIQRRLEGISQRILTKQLRDLEDCGLVHREVFAEVPPRVEYSLTQKGETLRPIILALMAWGKAYAFDILQEKKSA